LTRKTTLGFDVADFSKTVCGIELYPWQRWLLIHGLELLPGGEFRFRNVVCLVARQNGKSTLSQVLALFNMFVLGTKLVLGTAQDLDTAEEVWQGVVDLVEETPELAATLDRVVKVNGKKSLELTSGERYRVKAANRRAGRGLSGDLILLDELREHQSWDAWAAVTKTTMARPNAQVWALSNAGDVSSVVLRYLRKMAHKALGDPDGVNVADDPSLLLDQADADPDDIAVDVDATLGIFEWSAPPDSRIEGRTGWARANPSLGYAITERTLESASRTDPEWVFRTECLCQWSEGTLEGPFPPGAWEATLARDSQIAPGSALAVGVDVSWSHSAAYVAVAGWRADGVPHVEIVAADWGTDWVLRWFTSPERDAELVAAPLVVQSSGSPVAELLQPLREAELTVLEWKGSEVTRGTGRFYQRVRAAVGEGDEQVSLRHLPEPRLDVAAATAATKPAGDAWMWDRRKSPHDIAPLIAVTAALWGLEQPVERPAVSAYDSGARLEVL
jgi:phage terminase large subunit-like protein